MPRFSARKIKDLFTKSDAAKTKAEKGKYLEDLAVYLFEMVPGISMTVRDKKNTYETEDRRRALERAARERLQDAQLPHPCGVQELVIPRR